MAQLTGNTPIRRSRLFFSFLAFTFICIYLFIGSKETSNFIRSTFRLTSKQNSVDEIYGLISLVTRDSERSELILTAESLDVTQPVDMNVYAAKRGMKWEEELWRLNEEYPVVVFSKTWCPYSRKTKQLLETYKLSPPPKIIEVDLRQDAAQLKAILTRLTRRSTFPNVLLRGNSLGGSDDLHALHNANALRSTFLDAGIEVRGEF
ncbi:hypothetical protein GYMLUDRAFT_34997 [Collybiopsis luxurians FD-317 M1]|nr:hypothetical protein GYMLUDRAFT_34997 [Collybiopsis luxurians FD-317 M1]